MPYTDEFIRLKRHFNNQYSDKAKAETFAFEIAFKQKIKTFRERRPKQRLLKNPFEIDI